MYCVKDKEKWFCVDDTMYHSMYKQSEGVTGTELYRKYGKEYIQTKGGTYELKGTTQGE